SRDRDFVPQEPRSSLACADREGTGAADSQSRQRFVRHPRERQPPASEGGRRSSIGPHRGLKSQARTGEKTTSGSPLGNRWQRQTGVGVGAAVAGRGSAGTSGNSGGPTAVGDVEPRRRGKPAHEGRQVGAPPLVPKTIERDFAMPSPFPGMDPYLEN